MRLHLSPMILLLAALAATAPVSAQQVPAPAVRVGDTWEHESTDDWTSQVRMQERQEVIGVIQEFVRIRVDAKARNLKTNAMEPRSVEEETQRADMNVDYPSRDGGIQRRVNFAWPLEVGKKWTYEYTVVSVNTSGQSTSILSRMAAEVAGWESVTTPAGVFRALKVVHKGTMEYPGMVAPSRVGWTLWYSPETASQVKYTYQWDSASGTPGNRFTSLLTSYKRGSN